MANLMLRGWKFETWPELMIQTTCFNPFKQDEGQTCVGIDHNITSAKIVIKVTKVCFFLLA